MKKKGRPSPREDEEENKEPSTFRDSIKGPFNNPFASLKPPPPANEVNTTAEVKRRAAPPRAVVRVVRTETKVTTRIEQLALASHELSSWLLILKSLLDCGGSLDSDAIVLQGDHHARVKNWLEAHGVKKVSIA